MSGLIVIPARFASTRFPGKPLALLPDGYPMIQHVWRNAMALGHTVVVATDDTRIAAAVTQFGGVVCMTNDQHPSGTDRVWEVAEHYPEASWILNIQGDEPLITAMQLEPLLNSMETHPSDIWTLVTPLTHVADDPNRVKVARASTGKALYFSRAAIPYPRQATSQPVWHHIGVYLYTRQALQTWVNLPPSPLEQTEQLEQLRALDHGLHIHTVVVDYHGFGIDTPEDLQRLHNRLSV
jgi:3-deoxy-manno-octulosonate cytidylyltransferase (CMP-KDO synthetase)